MQDDLIHKIRSNPKYHELVSKRNSFKWTMAVIMLVIYYAFILTIAFDRAFMAQPLSEGSVTTIGIPIGVAVILFAFALTGVYVHRANAVFDRLNREIKEELL